MNRSQPRHTSAAHPMGALRPAWWLLTGYALIADLSAVPILIRAEARSDWLRGVALLLLLATVAGWLVESRDHRSRWAVVLVEGVTVFAVATMDA